MKKGIVAAQIQVRELAAVKSLVRIRHAASKGQPGGQRRSAS